VRTAEPSAGPIALTIVVPTSHGWPTIRPCLERLRDQAVAVGAEVIVADGSGGSPPPADPGWPGLVWLREPGPGVFALRALARGVARGTILAVTEDHCLVAPDWCARILEAHARHPEAVAVKGAVRNGTGERLLDRASFYLVQAPNLPPFAGEPEDAVLGVSCVSYRRRHLDTLAPDVARPVEIDDARQWRATRAAAIVADERISVEHHQSQGLLGVTAAHFHNARAVAGLRRDRMTSRDWVRVAAAPFLPFIRTVRTLTLCARKQVPAATMIACAPVFLWLYVWKGAGELTGYVRGPGDSATRI
jgi:hypothetical protein